MKKKSATKNSGYKFEIGETVFFLDNAKVETGIIRLQFEVSQFGTYNCYIIETEGTDRFRMKNETESELHRTKESLKNSIFQ